jgi:membrane protease YdiL (CAAX protease family)/uncharacterized protein YndB with AHSA1/START domain
VSSTRISRRVNAPRAAVYRAFLDAGAVATWMVPTGMTSHVHGFDAQEGGSFRISLTYDDPTANGKTTAHTDTYHGRFVKLVPDEQVVEAVEFETTDPAMHGEMTISITLADADGGTDVLAVHDGLPPGLSTADNEAGWQSSLAKLAALVEAENRLLPAVIAEPSAAGANAARWGPARAFTVIGIYLALQTWIAAGTAFVVAGTLAVISEANQQPVEQGALQARILMPTLLFAIILSGGGAVAFSLLFGKPRLGSSRPDGFGLVRSSRRAVLLALLVGIGLAAAYLTLPHFVPAPDVKALGPVARAASTPGSGRYYWLVLGLFVAPFVEEYLFRGVLTSGLRVRFGPLATTAIVAAVFTVLHVFEAIAYWPALVTIAALSVLTSVARERSGSLTPCFAMHFAYNLALALRVFAA